MPDVEDDPVHTTSTTTASAVGGTTVDAASGSDSEDADVTPILTQKAIIDAVSPANSPTPTPKLDGDDGGGSGEGDRIELKSDSPQRGVSTESERVSGSEHESGGDNNGGSVEDKPPPPVDPSVARVASLNVSTAGSEDKSATRSVNVAQLVGATGPQPPTANNNNQKGVTLEPAQPGGGGAGSSGERSPRVMSKKASEIDDAVKAVRKKGGASSEPVDADGGGSVDYDVTPKVSAEVVARAAKEQRRAKGKGSPAADKSSEEHTNKLNGDEGGNTTVTMKTLTLCGVSADGSSDGEAREVRVTLDESVDVYSLTDPSFRRKGKVGSGGFGDVFLYEWNYSPVAVKIMSHVAVDAVQEIIEEAQVLCKLRHRNVVTFMGLCDPLAIILEYMEGGDLHEFLHDKDVETHTWPRLGGIIMDIARGLAFLHSKGYPHRDLKPANILLTEHCTAKLADFGLSGNKSLNLEGAGTRRYCAPEVIQGEAADLAADIYSLGCIIVEVLTLDRPFKGRVKDRTKNPSLQPVATEQITGVLPNGALEVLLWTWEYEADSRPDMVDLMPSLVAMCDSFPTSGVRASVRGAQRSESMSRLTTPTAGGSGGGNATVDVLMEVTGLPPSSYANRDGYSDDENGNFPATAANGSGGVEGGEANGDGGMGDPSAGPMLAPEPVVLLKRAVKKIARHFRAAEAGSDEWNALGDDSRNSEIAGLVRGELCANLYAVFAYGYKTFKIGLGKYHVWDFFSKVPKELHEADKVSESSLSHAVEVVASTHSKVKDKSISFRSLMCYGLNNRVLHIWISLLQEDEPLLKKRFESFAFIRHSATRQLIIEVLAPLADLPFCLSLVHEIDTFNL